MVEGTHIPGTPACGEWETRLTDALDGLLKPDEEVRFEAHKAGCPACASLYEAARKGREWLEFLSPDPEPPEGLLAKILATTGPGAVVGHTVSGLPVPAACRCGSGLCPSRLATAGIPGADAGQCAATATDDGGHGVFLDCVNSESCRRAANEPAAGRSEAARGAVVHGAATDHGFGADRAVLRPSALCLRGRSGHA